MCGIIGYIGPRPVVPLIIEGLRKLEYRGYDSAGIAVVSDGVLAIRRSAGKLGNLETVLAADPLIGRVRPRPHPLGDARPARPRRTPTRTATATAGSSSSTTASSRTTWS